jgi:hypothetical protein
MINRLSIAVLSVFIVCGLLPAQVRRGVVTSSGYKRIENPIMVAPGQIINLSGPRARHERAGAGP